MNISEYLIFRHSVSKDFYKVPVNFSITEKSDVIPSVVEECLLKSIDTVKGDFTCFVSGGVDSSLLAAVGKAKVIYTSSFPGYEFDEVEWARMVANHIGAELRVVEIERDEYLASLEYLIRNKEDGLHPNEPCLYLVAKRAKKDGFNKILSGEGADDIFGGYTDLLKNGDKYLKNKETFLSRYAYFRPKTIGLPENIDFKTFKKWGMERFILEVHTAGLIQRAMNAGQAAGLKVYFPYLMGQLPQIMWCALPKLKINKFLLKESAERYLPKEVIYRKKIGFPVPLDKWLGEKGIQKFLLLNVKIWQSLI